MSIRIVFYVLVLSAIIIGYRGAEYKIISEKYPNLKFGFTTQNFNPVTPVTVDNTKKFIRYAREQGFSWIELRDPDASLSIDQCKKIAAFAARNNIEVNYSFQRELLAADFWDVFHKAVENSVVFNGSVFFELKYF